MKVTLLTHNDPGVAGKAAAMCYASDNPESALRGAMKSGHESISEHAVFTFHVDGVSRVVLAQITRHRLASFSVESQRYCGARTTQIIPQSVYDVGLDGEYKAFLRHARTFYERMVQCGVPREDARYASPEGTTTGFVMTMNVRELRHFFSLRCCNRAQWQIRAVADEMLKICREVAPNLFKDAGPGCVRGHCPECRPCGKPRKELMPE